MNERLSDGEKVDLLVVGGGITGAGIALDAASRGLKVTLIEKGDFACGTSSVSSKLIHGGIRYLKSRDFKLVYEALRERSLLLKLAPGIVKPMPFLIPVYDHSIKHFKKILRWFLTPERTTMMELIKAPLVLRVSIAFYDLLAGKHKIGRHRIMNRTEILGMEPMLNPIRLKGGAIYWDAFGLDFRLTLAVIKKAEGYGARCLNYAELLEFRREKNVIVAGVRDNLSDRKFRIFARKVVIATGPWLDRVRAKANMERMLKPTKGSHIIVSRSKLNIRNAVVMEAIDARLTFAIPWDSIVIVGTTEIDYANPDRVRATKEEVDYLLEVANRYFRSAELRYEDIITTYSGIRPLVDGKDSDISREHRVVEDDGIIFIGGGKLTTYRLMAKDVVDRVAQQSSKCITHLIQLKDFNIPSNFEEDIGKHLAEVYAKEEIDGIRQLIQENWHLGKRILPDQPFIWAEVNHAVEKEFALKLSDVLIRRLGLHFKMSLDLDVIRQIAEHMGMLLGWNAEQIENEVEDYLKEVRKNMEWKKEIQE